MKRTLCFLANPVASHTVNWVTHFATMGYETHLISFDQPLEPLKGVHMHLLKSRLPFHLKYFSQGGTVRKLLREIQPRLLHAHYASGYGTLGRLSGFHPYVLSVWGSDVYEVPRRSRLHRQLLVRNLVAADHLCSTSQAMAEELSKYTSKPVVITPFGVDCDLFSYDDNPRPEEREFVVGTVRSLERAYGIDYLLRAFKILVDRHADWPCRLVIVGGGTFESEYRALARQLGLEWRVHFVGRVPHATVVDYLKTFSVFVALSVEESFGVAVLEASACGIPVIASSVGGLPEVVENTRTGLLVPPKNPSAAADCLEKLLLSPSLRKSMGQAGRTWVRERYAWDQNSRIVENLYEGVISKMSSAGELSPCENALEAKA